MSQRKPRSPRKTSKGIKKTKLQRSARIANSSQETIDNEPSVISDETKSASEIEKTLPDIIPFRSAAGNVLFDQILCCISGIHISS